MAEDSPMRIEVALRYRGASVVGNSQLRKLATLPGDKSPRAYVDRMPPEFVDTKPKAIPVARL